MKQITVTLSTQRAKGLVSGIQLALPNLSLTDKEIEKAIERFIGLRVNELNTDGFIIQEMVKDLQIDKG